MPLLKTLGSIAEWLLDAGGVILAGLVNFIDWGYKAVEATETWIGDKFGEDAAAKFESFMTGLTKVMNVVVALGFAAADFSVAVLSLSEAASLTEVASFSEVTPGGIDVLVFTSDLVTTV